MDTINFQYEVAFSFLQRDEMIAFQINDLIQDRLKTFIYSKKQEELSGGDGEKKFNDVFFKDSRVVILLYREGWGQTPWTRIEETAIRNRAFENGWEFLLLVNLDKKSKLPAWIPKTYIWFDFQRWKAEGVAPVIEHKVQETGGNAKPESIEDRAKRFSRVRAEVKERDRFLRYGDGIRAANEEVSIIISLLKQSKEQLEDSATSFHFGTNERKNQMYEFGYDGYYLCFNSRNGFEYEMKDGQLIVTIYEKLGHQGINESERRIKQTTYKFDRDLHGNNLWTDGIKAYSTNELVRIWVMDFVETLEEREKNRGKH